MKEGENNMEKQQTYPIKYAIMPVKEPIGWDSGVENTTKGYEVATHMVVKCYVIREREIFLEDGSSKIQSEVVFLYNRTTPKGDFKPTVPHFSQDNRCTNSIVVDTLFDSRKEALEDAQKRNARIYDATLMKILRIQVDDASKRSDVKERLARLKSNFCRIRNKYDEIEKAIDLATSQIPITLSHEALLETLIDKILSRPKEFYAELARALPEEERRILEDVITKKCLNCTKSRGCKIWQSETSGYNGNSCPHWTNDELIGRQFINQKKDRKLLF